MSHNDSQKLIPNIAVDGRESQVSNSKRQKICSNSEEDDLNDRQYFRSYEDLSIHMDMIKDVSRTNTYRLAILKSFGAISGKVVADIGAGTGILSCFCVQAGAKKVCAVEASSVAEKANEVIRANKMADRIKVIRGRVEDITLPEKVDVIVSEWMGHFLLYESMLKSVIHARDNWLKEGGSILPSSAHIYLAPFTNEFIHKERVDYWTRTSNLYGVDMSCLVPHSKKSLSSRIHVELVPDADLIAKECKCIDLDLMNVTDKDLQQLSGTFSFDCFGSDQLCGFVSWFSVKFNSTDQGKELVELSTAPNCQPTHWKQSVMYLGDTASVQQGSQIEGTITLSPNSKNPRFLDVELMFSVDGEPQTTSKYKLNDGMS
ncbi:protein arginine N-methyltransferase 6-like [Apostichopus japonicus]|uniref:protein arginine N-methyltransferase 6-like n=1 Tax=Stichopus japonicus TaxID=307972 RepID=UPI003AB179C3